MQTALLPEAIAETMEQEAGLLIVSVESESPAAAAGLLVGDILTALDGAPLEDVDELQAILAASAIGSTLATRIRARWRNPRGQCHGRRALDAFASEDAEENRGQRKGEPKVAVKGAVGI